MAAKSSSRGGTAIRLIAVHTNEGPNPAFETVDNRAENLARWMNGQQVSYHKIVDDDSVVHYVPDARMSWSLRSGNSRSLNVCLIGRAAWPRGEWLLHDRMLRMTADVVRNWCLTRYIPMRKLTSSQVGADMSGIIGHVDWTRGKRDGSHTDPGDQFPWDVFMRYVTEAPLKSSPPEEDIMASIADLRRVLEDHARREDDLSPSRRVDTGYAQKQVQEDLMELARNLDLRIKAQDAKLDAILGLLTEPKG